PNPDHPLGRTVVEAGTQAGRSAGGGHMRWSDEYTGYAAAVASFAAVVLWAALDGAGFGVAHCPGPPFRACPVYAGRPCPVHGRPVAAVIVREPGSSTPVPPCGRALHIPALPVEAGDRAPAEAIRDLTAIRAAW